MITNLVLYLDLNLSKKPGSGSGLNESGSAMLLEGNIFSKPVSSLPSSYLPRFCSFPSWFLLFSFHLTTSPFFLTIFRGFLRRCTTPPTFTHVAAIFYGFQVNPATTFSICVSEHLGGQFPSWFLLFSFHLSSLILLFFGGFLSRCTTLQPTIFSS